MLTAWLTLPLRADDSLSELQQKYLSLLAKQADQLQAFGDAEAADVVRAWPLAKQPGRNYLQMLPGDVNRPAVLDEREELARLQKFYAGHLLRHAEAALESGGRAQAYQLACEALRADPQNELARRVVKQDSSPTRNMKKFGSNWILETEHFHITSTADKDATEQVGHRLEELHYVWRQLFAEFWFTEAELKRRFAGQPSRLFEPTHKVMLFANKQQYVDYLKRDEPGIEVSLGYYAERPRTAYFYADETTLPTQFHEATHQLFHESERRRRSAGLDDNFWVVEGIATYMESLQKGSGYYVVGGPGAYRLQFARYRALTEEQYVPLSELVNMGRAQMQASGANLARLYSQSAGLAHFFMDAQGGKYRQAFVQYLDQVYRDRADAATLARLTGQRYEALDEEYLEFLRVDDEDLTTLIPGENVPRLYLGRTQITDASIPHIAQVNGLERLDVGYCRISDAGIRKLPASKSIVQLNFEQTELTDEALPHLAGFQQLQELDISGCKITDAGLSHIAQLKHLEILWLTGTSISDTGLSQLHGLKKLKFVDVDGTNVTAGGWGELKRAVPGVSNETE